MREKKARREPSRTFAWERELIGFRSAAKIRPLASLGLIVFAATTVFAQDPFPVSSCQVHTLPLLTLKVSQYVPLQKPALSRFSHPFWDRTNAYLFAGIGVVRTLDYTSTINMRARGREEILLPDEVVNNRAGFAALEAAGVATSIGISYIFHRTGHHKLERWLSIGHISVAGFGAARNYALDSKHSPP